MLESIKQKFKEIIQNRKLIVCFVIVFVLLFVDIVLGIISGDLVLQLPEQNEASRWSTDKRMAQISLFFTEDQKIDETFIKRMEYVMEGAMSDAGIIEEKDNKSKVIIDTQKLGEDNPDSEEETDDSQVYTSSFCAQGLVSITFENKTAENVTAIGTSGDFFLFHPLELVSGNYYDGNSLMKDSIVIDEDLSWQLFGSSDVAGQMVMIGNVPHYVAGVVKREEGRIREASGLSNTMVYLSYDSLCKYGEILSGRNSSEEISEDGVTALTGGINCYEVVMPNPVDGIAAQIVKKASGLDDRYIQVVDNTDRFSFISLFKVLSSFGTRSMWSKAIYYPYWENTARGYEDILALILGIRLICRITVTLILVVLIVISYKNKKWTVSGIVQKLSDKKYDFEVKCKQKKS